MFDEKYLKNNFITFCVFITFCGVKAPHKIWIQWAQWLQRIVEGDRI